MPAPKDSGRVFRFGVFEADVGRLELRKHGIRVGLQEQPFQVLATLLERRGEIVTRDELRQQLWPSDVFVDFDHGLNKAVNKIREALGDPANNPRFLETVPRHGYRFIAPVEVLPGEHAELPGAARESRVTPQPAPVRAHVEPPAPASRARRLRLLLATVSGALLLLLGFLAIQKFWPRSAPQAQRAMLLVLPFTNMGNDPQQEYFCDSMTEEMILHLGRLHPERLGVIARTSAMVYKSAPKPAAEIGRELGVQYILEGSIRQLADRVRVVVKLIQASDQTQVWANSYERELRDIVGLQRELTQTIADEINLKLGAEQRSQLAQGRPIHPEAYRAYLLGRYSVSKFTQEGLSKGIEYLHQASVMDPNYALSYDGLAYYYIIANDWLLPPREAMPRAREAARRALKIDDSLADAHASLGIVYFWYDWDWPAAEGEFRRALELNPSSARAHEFYGWYLAAMGRFDEAVEQEKRALDYDPLSPEINTLLGHVLYLARRPDEAVAPLSKAIRLDPNYWFARLLLGLVYQQRGQLQEALAEFREARRIEKETPEPLGALGLAYALLGDKAQARAMLQELKARSKRQYVPPYQMAKIHLGLGEKDQALAWLEKAFEERSLFLTWLKVEPEMDSLRSDPRFQDLLRRVGLPP